MSLAEDVSKILGLKVDQGKWKQGFERIETVGRPTRTEVNKIIVTLCEHVEQLEHATDKTKFNP